MDSPAARENFIRFLAQLRTEDLEQTDFLDELGKLAPEISAQDLAEIGGTRHSFERAGWAAARPVDAKRLQRLRGLTERMQPGAQPAYRMARREMPIAHSVLSGSQPAWAAGTTPERSLGPVAAEDGRRYWFDLYPIVRLTALYLAGESDPAILMQVPAGPTRGQSSKRARAAAAPAGPPNPRELIERLRSGRFTLPAGSLWVRADLLAAGAPAKHYVGLKLQSGRVLLDGDLNESAGKLTIPAGVTCSLRLQLAPADPPAGEASDHDAGRADLQTPQTLAFHFSKKERKIEEAGRAGWRLFGQQLAFEWDGQQAPVYDAVLQGVRIPYTSSEQEFTVKKAKSALAQASGRATIVQAGWLLPAAQIDVSQPVAASSNGGLAVQGNSDLTLTWRGLRDGPVALPNPWIALFPGLLLIIDLHAGNLYAGQRFRLWQDGDSAYRSEVEVSYTQSFPLIYAAGLQNSELVLAQVNAEARLDRPVDVAGRALEIRSKNSLLALLYTPALQLVYLYDDNILLDQIDPSQPPAGQLPEPIALALHNALFSTTPVNGFLLFAELFDEEMVDVGNVFLVFGLYGLLPTLPDPYAANVGVFRRRDRRTELSNSISMLLLGQIVWQKAAGDDPDNVATGFYLLPFGQGGNELPTPSVPDTVDPTPFRGSSIRDQPKWGQVWDRYFYRFYLEQYALLDVSTNADWMGVSLAWFNPEQVQDNDRIFYQIYGAGQNQDGTQNLFPLQVQGMDLTAEGRFVRAFTVPQNSWEPLINLTPPQVPGDPPIAFNFFPNDGGPTRIFNDNTERVPIAPLPKIDELMRYFRETAAGFTGALFTLPYGLRAFAEFNKNHNYLPDANLELNQETFRDGALTGALQLRVDAPERGVESPMFIGSTLQLDNIVFPNGTPTGAGTLGNSVSEIFNNEFFVLTNGYGERGVPLSRIDFSGYGASTFSRWENPEAAFSETSQARFDIFLGRTAHEVIQVRSVIYPDAVYAVRTIVVFRAGSSYTYRFDTGWIAETPGVYDFSFRARSVPNGPAVHYPNPYEIHPGVFKGVYNVRNIVETPDIPIFERVWSLPDGDFYIDDRGLRVDVTPATPASERNLTVKLQPVYYDADAAIDFVVSGASNGKVPAKRLLGYVQLAPKGRPIPPEMFQALLQEQFGSLGGPVDCQINVGETGQQMRVTRVDVSQSIDAAGVKPVFVGTARGSVVLPKDGAWSMVQYQHGTGEVSPLPDNAAVPLIRMGKLGLPATAPLRLENPMELARLPQSASIFFGMLQSTGTQKALFRKPRFAQGVDELLSEIPDFSDAYRMLNSAGIFPNLQDAIPLDLGAFKTRIIEEGFKLLDEANPGAILEKALPDGPWFIVNEDFLKIYIEYDKRDKNGNKQSDGAISFGIDSAAADMGKRWLSKLSNITMVVDLGPLTRLMMIKGKFDAEKGAAPTFQGPELEFSDALQPVIDILQILLMLQGGDYADAIAKGLEVAMSNSADSWQYAFHATKEIPVVRFPPPALDSPTAPLKLEAGLSVGVYFNEVFDLTGDPSQLIPSVGAFLEFYGRLSVMCVSVAAATIYATGSVNLRIAADIKTGPSLYMKFGFGAELNVGLPVIGNVSILFMVGVEITLDSTQITTAAFLLFRGRAEILGGIVTVTIMIEAKGIIQRQLGPGVTNMIAQVTFGLDISIFLVINISFEESWEEERQIA